MPWQRDGNAMAMQCNAMQRTATQCDGNSKQCSTMQWQCNVMQCNATQYYAMQTNPMKCNAIQYDAMEIKRNVIQCDDKA
eukprot:4016348-Pyramimonas_sp.AAC.1